MNTHDLVTSCGRFRITRSGNPNGDKVVMLHGLAASHHLWDDVIDSLEHGDARGRYDIVACDTLGHGRSDKPRHLFTIQHHAESIITLMETLQWDSACFVGNSMGAQISFAAAAMFPERVSAISSIGCPAFASSAERSSWLVKRSALVDLNSGMPLPREPLGTTPTAEAVQVDRDWIGLWVLNSIWAIASYDLMSDLQSVRVPIQVMYGVDDWLIDTGRNLAVLPCVTETVIESAGHHAPVDQPTAVADSLHQFLSGVIGPKPNERIAVGGD